MTRAPRGPSAARDWGPPGARRPPRSATVRIAAARMRYADPRQTGILLGNRTLLFIFITFALVTLLQQILYGRNYIKR